MTEPPRRVNFFSGMILTAVDLAAEQQYHQGMRYLHNRLHGYGTVSGLDVTLSNGQLLVSPGLAIDVLGREIVVTDPVTLPVEPNQEAGPWTQDLLVAWHETPERPVPGPGGGVNFSRWVERPELTLVAEGRCAADGLLLARVTQTSDGAVDVDSSVRRPFGPA
jgi:hypothetical protein